MLICQLGSDVDSSVVIGYTSVASAIIILFSFFIILRSKSIFVVNVAVIAISSYILYLNLNIKGDILEFYILYGSQQPVIVILNKNRNRTIVINTSSTQITREVISYLAESGVKTINTLIIPGGTVDYYKGADLLGFMVDVESIYTDSMSEFSSKGKLVLKQCMRNGANSYLYSTDTESKDSSNSFVTVSHDENEYSITVNNVSIKVLYSELGLCYVFVEAYGQTRKGFFKPSLNPSSISFMINI